MDRKDILHSLLIFMIVYLNLRIVGHFFAPSVEADTHATEHLMRVLRENLVPPPSSGQEIVLQNSNLSLSFSPHTGSIVQARAKQYRSYDKAPLLFFDSNAHGMGVELTIPSTQVSTESDILDLLENYEVVLEEHINHPKVVALACQAAHNNYQQVVRKLFEKGLDPDANHLALDKRLTLRELSKEEGKKWVQKMLQTYGSKEVQEQVADPSTALSPERRSSPVALAQALSAQLGSYTTHDFPCTVEHSPDDPDTISFVHALDEDGGRAIVQTYHLPAQSYQVDYTITLRGIDPSDARITIQWTDDVRRLELYPDIARREASFHYKLGNERMTARNLSKEINLEKGKIALQTSPRATPWERFRGVQPTSRSKVLQWVGVKRKAFVVSIIPLQPAIDSLQLLNVPVTAPEVAYLSHMAISLTTPCLPKDSTRFRFYLGPNDYRFLYGVAPGFEESQYLGYWGIRHCNKYIIMPAASYLQKHAGHPLYVLLLLLLLFKLFLLPFGYQAHVTKLRKKALQPLLDAHLKQYSEDSPEELELYKLRFYQNHGVGFSVWSMLSALLQTPFFLSMVFFTKSSLLFRQVPFLWIEDLSCYDRFFVLPYKVPLLGSHISLTTWLVIAVFFLPRMYQQVDTQSTLPYFLMPLIFGITFNSAPAASLLYQIASSAMDLCVGYLFGLFTNEEQVQAKALASAASQPGKPKSSLTRAQARMQKRKHL